MNTTSSNRDMGSGLSPETLAFGTDAANALLGLDRLYRDESGDPTGLVVLNMDLDRRLEPAEFENYGAAERAFTELRERSTSLSEADRALYYRQLCDSSLAFVEWREGGLSFQEQLSRFLHVPAAPVSEEEIAALEAGLAALLDERGFTGSLKEQCATWERDVTVAPDEVRSVLASLMDESWALTKESLIDIPAPRHDAMGAATVRGVAYNARCNYLERTVEVNVDPVLTRPGLRHLAVHEGCPGHYVQFKLREVGANNGSAAADVWLSVVNTASSSVFEGIADTGLAMLGWNDDLDDRIQGLLTRHRAAIGTVAAWLLHAEGQDRATVKAALATWALTGGEGWVENRLRFVEAPARAVLIWSYWWGERVVKPAWERVAASDREAFLDFLYTRMHSVDTVGMFDPA